MLVSTAADSVEKSGMLGERFKDLCERITVKVSNTRRKLENTKVFTSSKQPQ